MRDTVLQTIDLWNKSKKTPKTPLSLLLELFRAPSELTKAKFKECMTDLGRSVVILAVDVQ